MGNYSRQLGSIDKLTANTYGDSVTLVSMAPRESEGEGEVLKDGEIRVREDYAVKSARETI